MVRNSIFALVLIVLPAAAEVIPLEPLDPKTLSEKALSEIGPLGEQLDKPKSFFESRTINDLKALAKIEGLDTERAPASR